MKKLISREFLSRKSFFFRFLRSYLIVLCIPFLTIAITYFHSQSTIRNEILSSNNNNLNQFITILDMELGGMVDKASQILGSNTVRKQVLFHYSPSNPSSAYEIYEVKKYLEDIPLNDISDVFVYIKSLDRIISGDRSSLGSRDYFNTYFKNAYDNLSEENDSYESFYAALNPDKLAPHLMVLGQEEDVPSLGVVLSQNYSTATKKGDATAVLILKPELLDSLLEHAMFQNRGAVMIYDRDNNLLVSSDNKKLEINLSDYPDSSHIYYDRIDGQEYVLKVIPSGVLDCYYVSVVASKVFWEKLDGLRTISIISIALSTLVSILLSWLFTRNSYFPIHSLIHAIHDNSEFQFDFKKKNELDFIREVILNSFTENDLLSSRIENSSNNLFEDFLLHAMRGTLTNSKFLKKDSEQILMHFISDSFGVLLINIDDTKEEITGPIDKEEGLSTLSLIVMNVMLELCARTHKGFVIHLMPKIYAVILNYAKGYDPLLKQQDALTIAGDFQDFTKKYFYLTSTLSVSSPVDGIDNIKEAYKQALKAMEYRYSFGKGSLIAYRDIDGKKFHYNNSFNSKNTLILIQYVKENAQTDIREIMNDILQNSMIDQNSSLSVIECFRYDLINTVTKIIYEIGALELEKEESLIQSLISAETFDEFKELLMQTLLLLKKYRTECKEQVTICDRAEDIIKEDYMDINLNVSIIADKLNITPSYLSKLFKNQKCISLLDYLYQIRLTVAKKLLKETSLTVEEIALKTGFISNSALTKTFKKYEGITPGVYRKLF